MATCEASRRPARMAALVAAIAAAPCAAATCVPNSLASSAKQDPVPRIPAGLVADARPGSAEARTARDRSAETEGVNR